MHLLMGMIVKPSHTVIRSKDIIIDGRLMSQFGLKVRLFLASYKRSKANDPATHRTEVRVALDDEVIYI